MNRNPDWSEDEIILVIDLLQRSGAQVPDTSDPRLVSLSERLRSLPLHPLEARQPKFRSPSSVRLKCFNLIANEPGLYPRGNLVSTNREIWRRYWHDHVAVAARIAEIEEAQRVLTHLAELDAETWAEEEGGLVMRAHHFRERSRALRAKVLQSSGARLGGVRCAGCDVRPERFSCDAATAMAAFEVHHNVPLRDRSIAQATRVSDLSVLCATCHRLIHSLMRTSSASVTVEQLRDVVRVK